jgi:predicted NAD/FAD-dependent oxidoreductase
MTALPKALAAALAPKLQWEVTSVERLDDHWWLHSIDSTRTGPFDWVIATAPAPQILQWFPPQFSGMDALQQVRYVPCFALMLGYTELPELHWDVARVKSSPIDWIVRGNSRPDQHRQQTMLLHSTHAWAHQQQNTNFDNIELTLRQALEDILNQPMPAPLLSLLHRWSYAATVQTTQSPFELDVVNSLAACGDWSVFSNADNGGARVEAAFSSANALAEQLLALPEFAA